MWVIREAGTMLITVHYVCHDLTEITFSLYMDLDLGLKITAPYVSWRVVFCHRVPGETEEVKAALDHQGCKYIQRMEYRYHLGVQIYIEGGVHIPRG